MAPKDAPVLCPGAQGQIQLRSCGGGAAEGMRFAEQVILTWEMPLGYLRSRGPLHGQRQEG